MESTEPYGRAHTPDPPGPPPPPGYRLVRQLGRGGFGEVWEAEAPGGMRVALKFVQIQGRAGEYELRALELVKGIRHPNLLALFDAWQIGNTLVMGMELAEGAVSDRLREARAAGSEGIPREELLDLMGQAARGIDHLNAGKHRPGDGEPVGVQHRDIKPQNLLLVGGGLKVADYGLARLMERDLTGHTGSMTPSYAAPEFFLGQTSDRSDQYSLAVTYCMLRGGRLPFAGNAAAVTAGHLQFPPDLSMLPGPERPAVARALAKQPSDRWPSCREFVAALASAPPESQTAPAAFLPEPGGLLPTERDSRPPTEPALGPLPARNRPRRGAWLVAGTSGVLLVAGLASRVGPGPGAGPATTPIGPVHPRTDPTASTGRPATSDPGWPTVAAPAPETTPPTPAAATSGFPGPLPATTEPLAGEPVPATAKPAGGESPDPAAGEIHFRRADELFARGEYARAIAEYDEGIRLSPEDAAALINLGNACQKTEDYARALASYDRSIALDPGEPAAFFNRGNARAAQGQHALAIEDFGRAITLKPGFAAAYHNRGVVYERAGDASRARADLEEAARLDTAVVPAP